MFPTETPPAPLAVGAPPDDQAPAPNPMVTIPLTADELAKWKGDLTRANTRREVFEPSWKRNLESYSPDPTNEAWGTEVNPGVDFWQVEQKKDQLFFETPEVILTPEDDTSPDAMQPIYAHQAKVNQRLGRKGLDAKRLMDKVLFSVLCTSGMGCTKLGVTRITKDVPLPHPSIPGQMQMGPDGQTPLTAPVPVYQKIFWEHFSEKKILIPTNFHDTEFDKAPWLGMKFTMPTRQAIREFGLPPDFKGKTSQSDDQVFSQPGVKTEESDEDQTTGSEVFYRAALYDDAVYHPDHLRQLVFVDGEDDPVVHRDCPYQTFQGGQFQPDDPKNLIGNPIHIFTIRDLLDSAYVPSDCTITRPLVQELALFRTQLINHRDASTSIRLGKQSVFTPEILSKVVRGPFGSILVVPDEVLTGPPPIQEVTHAVYSHENFQAQQIIEGDLNKVNALAANQAGAQQDTVRSATELTYVERNKDVRMQAERNRILAGFVGGVTKLDALMKRFETPPGQQPISGYTYDIKPDSGMHIDAAADRKFALDRYNMLAKDPNVNRMYLLKELAPDLRLDAAQLIVQPPPPHPPTPKTSIAVKGEDLSPLNPQYPNVIEALKAIGLTLTAVPITPEMIQNAAMAQPVKSPPQPHGGAADEADKVNKHSSDLVGHPQHFGGQAAVQ